MTDPIDPLKPGKRPPHVKPPRDWPNPPIPEPEVRPDPSDPLDPVRYGDWEKKGIAVDF